MYLNDCFINIANILLPLFHGNFKVVTFSSCSVRSSTDGLSASAVVQIIVTDKNDNRPTFEPSHYTFNLNASISPGPLLTVQAYDLDSGLYGTVSYAFVDYIDFGHFYVDAGSGLCTSFLIFIQPTYIKDIMKRKQLVLNSRKHFTFFHILLMFVFSLLNLSSI